jgi:hypothetical protein
MLFVKNYQHTAINPSAKLKTKIASTAMAQNVIFHLIFIILKEKLVFTSSVPWLSPGMIRPA